MENGQSPLQEFIRVENKPYVILQSGHNPLQKFIRVE